MGGEAGVRRFRQHAQRQAKLGSVPVFASRSDFLFSQPTTVNFGFFEWKTRTNLKTGDRTIDNVSVISNGAFQHNTQNCQQSLWQDSFGRLSCVEEFFGAYLFVQ